MTESTRDQHRNAELDRSQSGIGPSEVGRLWAGLLREAAFAGVFFAATFLLCLRAWESPTTQWVGGCCDSELSIWYQQWFPFAIAHGLNPLVTDYMNFPHGINLMWNVSEPLMAVLVSPLSETLGPIFAYNASITLALALSAWFAFLALRQYTRTIWAAGVGGAVYGFSPYMVTHATEHLHLVLAFTAPLILLLFDEIMVRRRYPPLRLGIALGIVTVAQLLLGEEILAGEALTAFILAATLAVLYPRAVRLAVPYVARVVWIALLTFIVPGAWPLMTQFFGPQRTIGAIFPIAQFSTDVANLVTPTSAQAFVPPGGDALAIASSGFVFETTGFVGLPLIFLAAFTVGRWWDSAVVRVAAVTGAAVTTLSLGPRLKMGGHLTDIPLPWGLATHVPVLNSALPSRLMLYTYFSLGVLVAIFVDRAVLRAGRKAGGVAAAALVLALLPLVPEPLPAYQPSTPSFFSNWRTNDIPRGSVALIAPRTMAVYQAHQVLWQMAAGYAFKMPDGYFLAPTPGGGAVLTARPSPVLRAMDDVQYGGRVPLLTPSERLRISDDLQRKRVDTVIVGPMDHANLMVTFFQRLFRRPPILSGGVAFWPGVLRFGIVP